MEKIVEMAKIIFNDSPAQSLTEHLLRQARSWIYALHTQVDTYFFLDSFSIWLYSYDNLDTDSIDAPVESTEI